MPSLTAVDPCLGELSASPDHGSPRLAVLIPVRNDHTGLVRCLTALARQDLSGCEVLVADDGSDPAISTDALVIPGLLYRLFRCAGRGPAGARNRLARETCADYLVFLDADTEPHDDLLVRIRAILGAHPGLLSFFGSYDADPGAAGLVSSYRNLLHHHVHQTAGDWVSTFWCGCGVMSRALYLEEGGLSESYTEPSIEDIELGMRLARRGIRTRVFPELQVKHHKRWTLRSFLATDLWRRGIPWVRLLRSHRHCSPELNLGWRHRISALAAAVLVAGLLWFSVSGSVAVVAAGATVFSAANLPLFARIAGARNLAHALAAWPLHLLHTLVSILSVPLGLLPRWNDAAALDPAPDVETGDPRA